MTTTDGTPLRVPNPETPQPAHLPEPEMPTRPSSALAWAQLALCTASVICGVIIGLTCSITLGAALASAGVSGAGIRIVINVRR
ncbi:hypothetical protein QF027_004641 [Streptomyces canus]|nr:hypothetical protein [Streptomyces canus]